MSSRKRIQVSRLKPVPPKLRTVMDLVNSLPPELPRHTFAEMARGVAPKYFEQFLDTWREFVKACQPVLRRMLGPVRKDTYEEVRDLCENLQKDRELLRAIARKSQGRPFRCPGKSQDRSFRHPSAGSHIEVGKDGRLEFLKGPTLQALEEVEADRIRQCLVCEKIFWAGRKDKKCCGPRCLKAWHTRRWRGKYLDS